MALLTGDLGELLQEHSTTYVGTLMANKREIRPKLKKNINPEDSELVFGAPNGKVTLCWYQAKSPKSLSLIMISSQHHD